ncbi:YdcF family protein [Capilliphycus salinus ALCB114379]|uniref:YdcF family protein n=1 Tax=Capilliphycus salinus TaxID=2768948 RepID=UPI0039A6D152
MFLFLSKLLPLFIYPLGLTCLLMIAALILIWKQPRLAFGAIALGLLILLVSSNSWISQSLVRSLEGQNLPNGELPKATAIVVLGGGTKPPIPPRPWVDVSEAGDRILYGSLLYKQDKAPWLILSGGRIQWDGKQPPESADMAEIATAMGVPESAILQDPASLNTYQNAVNVRQILEQRNLTGKVLLVTSALHMPRSLLVFRRQGIEVIPAPTDFLVSQADLQPTTTIQATILNLIPDTQSLQQFTQALKEYIGILIYRLRGWL